MCPATVLGIIPLEIVFLGSCTFLIICAHRWLRWASLRLCWRILVIGVTFELLFVRYATSWRWHVLFVLTFIVRCCIRWYGLVPWDLSSLGPQSLSVCNLCLPLVMGDYLLFCCYYTFSDLSEPKTCCFWLSYCSSTRWGDCSTLLSCICTMYLSSVLVRCLAQHPSQQSVCHRCVSSSYLFDYGRWHIWGWSLPYSRVT